MNIKEHKKLIILILISLILILGSFLISFYVVNKKLKEKNKKQISIVNYFNNNSDLKFKKIIIGMSFGIVLGFIDNAGLWFGINSLEKYIPGGILEKAGWGNTYSDFLGATLGTSIAIILKTFTPITNTPIWADSLGVLIGCILGIYIPKYLSNFFNSL